MHFPTDQSQLNFKLAFMFQQQFSIWIPIENNWKIPIWIYIV
jgi:hypothetical protein